MDSENINLTQNEMRTGARWNQLMAKYRIHNIADAPDGNGWLVESTSGHTYRVSRRVSHNPNASDFYWACDCPARKRCRHIEATADMLYAEIHAAIAGGDGQAIDDMEIFERTN